MAKLTLSFAGAGFLGVYHVGSLAAIREGLKRLKRHFRHYYKDKAKNEGIKPRKWGVISRIETIVSSNPYQGKFKKYFSMILKR